MLNFAAPVYLFALGALVVPILIHLINRQRAEPLRFPSIRFIGPSALPQGGRRSPKDWLLLLLRMLLLAFVVLALAQPQWQAGEALPGQRAAPQATLYIIDASASMSRGTAWQNALEIAAESRRSLSPGEAVGWVVYTDRVIADVAPAPGQSLNLEVISPQPLAGNPIAAMERARTLIPEGLPGRIVWISDFQASEWSGLALPPLPEAVELELMPVEAETANLGIVAAKVFPASEGQLTLIARVKNFGNEPLSAKILLDGADAQSVTVEPQAVEPVIFTSTDMGAVARTLALQSADDVYAWDDTYAVWFGAPPPLKVGLVLSEEDEPEKVTEAQFILRALEVGSRSGHRSFQVVQTGEGALADPARRPDVIYLAGAGGYLGEDQLAALKAYVESGGVLLVTPSRVASRQQRALRAAGLTDIAYVGQPGQHHDRRDTYHIGGINEHSRIGQLFDEATARDLYLAEIYQYAKLRPSAQARVLLEEEAGDPLLLEESLGQGSVLTSAIGFDGSWTDLPLRNAFLPLLRETLLGALPAIDSIQRMTLGEAEGLAEPRAWMADGEVREANVDRSESEGATMPLMEIRRAMRAGAVSAPSLEPASAAESTALWPFFALAALFVYLLETLLSPSRSPQTEVRHA